ncbi:GNAT family N-acetyltransferase [Actinobacteria bacterium YIM 96077]|uniref:GNAT family N-acetyltransferase n=1 Tax=Phytoactinopolyspora halophila TaxID=1981511 RepID=A0A329R0Q0_9ACTN|nr:GNAT family N-acetyltransferase [Phytoactinopolyspora halophila]AYY15120.1 GNAT family N-acetyltransferase [Actinobacteria bacterium YIM 96077]RAW18204.1 GNAT family N-acetyltransferase [Phytoactinopolyspora halophila]
MDVRPYRKGDDDALYEVCLKTGPGGEDAFSDRRLLGEIYVGPYLAFEPDLAFVVEDDEGVSGYVLGAKETRAFEQRCEAEWWPALRRRYPLGTYPDDVTEARFVRLIHNPWTAAEDIVANYPSHLHIDLLPRTQGHGMGRVLMKRLLDALRDAGSPGVHLGVGASNTNAIGFYRHLGFTTLRESSTALVMGRSTSTSADQIA